MLYRVSDLVYMLHIYYEFRINVLNITIFRAQLEDGSIRGAETCCC